LEQNISELKNELHGVKEKNELELKRAELEIEQMRQE
jgi:hypothetical protein